MAFAPTPMATPSWLRPKASTPANGLLGLLGVQQNPFLDFLGQHSNALVGLGAGIAGGGPDLGQAVGQGLTLAQQGKTADFNRSEKAKADATLAAQTNATKAYLQQNHPDLAAAVDAGLPLNQAWTEALRQQDGTTANDPAATVGGRAQLAQTWGLQGDDAKTYVLTGKLPGGNQTSRAGLGQPVYIRNKNDPTKIIGIQPMTTGPGVDLMTGQPVPDPQNWNVDPIGIAGDRTGAIKDATNSASARASLPSAQNAFDQTVAVLNKFDPSSPGYDKSVVAGAGENFGNVLGVPQQWLPVIPKTDRANFLNIVDQLSGQAFLNIRQALKGAGQVTDYEGGKGEIALSRMRAAAERGDRASFDQAMLDYKTAIDNGMRLLREQAQGGFSQGQPAVSGAPTQAPAPAPVQSTGDPELDNALQQYGQ